MQELLSLAAVIPTLLERFDLALASCESSDSATRLCLCRDFVQMLTQLEIWEQSYRHSLPRTPYWVKPSDCTQSLNCTPTDISNTSLWYCDVFVANAFTHLWAFRLICLVHLEQVQENFLSRSQHTPSMNHTFISQTCQEGVVELSTKILQSMDYLIQDGLMIYGPISMLFPFKAAHNALRLNQSGNQKHATWCHMITNRLICRGFISEDLVQ